MPANLSPRVSDSVFALAALIVKKELLFFNVTGIRPLAPVQNSVSLKVDDYLRQKLVNSP